MNTPVTFLRGFGYVWCTLAVLFITVCMIAIWLKEGFAKIEAVMSPFNILNFIAVGAILGPGLLAFWLANKLVQRRASKKHSELEHEHRSVPRRALLHKYGNAPRIKATPIALFVIVPCVLAYIVHVSAHSDGELYPYYPAPDFRFVGSYFESDVFVRPSATVRLKDGVLVADTFIVTEELKGIVRNQSTNRVAMTTSANMPSVLKDTEFMIPPSDSILAKALEVYVSQCSANGQKRSGRRRDWLYVGLTPDLAGLYVSTTSGGRQVNDLELIPLLFIKEQRCSLYINAKKRQFAPVNTDLLGTPQEDLVYREMRDGEMEDEVWKIVRDAG